MSAALNNLNSTYQGIAQFCQIQLFSAYSTLNSYFKRTVLSRHLVCQRGTQIAYILVNEQSLHPHTQD